MNNAKQFGTVQYVLESDCTVSLLLTQLCVKVDGLVQALSTLNLPPITREHPYPNYTNLHFVNSLLTINGH